VKRNPGRPRRRPGFRWRSIRATRMSQRARSPLVQPHDPRLRQRVEMQRVARIERSEMRDLRCSPHPEFRCEQA
jgi:hypothetical protein